MSYGARRRGKVGNARLAPSKAKVVTKSKRSAAPKKKCESTSS